MFYSILQIKEKYSDSVVSEICIGSYLTYKNAINALNAEIERESCSESLKQKMLYPSGLVTNGNGLKIQNRKEND